MADALRLWLDQIGLAALAEVFAANDIDVDLLPDLSDADLRELGLSLGQRRRLLRAVAERAREVPPAVTAPPDAEPARAAERRQLTVLFCDLVGSTELSRRLDPEDLRELTRRYQDAVTGSVVRHGGYVANFLGDGLVAYFGWPRADEDDAAQAVRAGLDAVAAVGDLGLRARVGIASGIVVVGDLEAAGRRQTGAIAGETPNLAARLQAVAEPGQVVIDGLTRQLIGSAFTLEDLGRQSLKGVGEPVSAWRALAERLVVSRFEARAGRLTPLIGREHEIALLLERFERAAAGEGQAVLLSGEAGIGKSRLVQMLHQRLAAVPHTRVRLQCSPFHTASELYPVIRHLEYAAGFQRDDALDIRRDKLAALLRQGADEVADALAMLAPLLSLTGSEAAMADELWAARRREQTMRVMVEQLLGLASRSPLLLVVEDAHWIDPATQEVLGGLLARLADARILLLVTHRPEFQADWARLPQVTALTLGRLSRGQAAEVVNAAGGKALPAAVVARIGQRADGVPLYLEELTRSVLEAGGAFGDSGIPESLQASLLARLDRLGPDAKELTQIAAVIGREFAADLLCAVAEKPREALGPVLARLVQSQIVLPVGAAPDGAYSFRHALLQDAAYQSLLLSRRRDYHLAIARTLETGFPETAETRPEQVAQHYTAAGASEPAIRYWRRAAERAAARYANREVVACLEQAVQLARGLPEGSGGPQQVLEVTLALGAARLRATRFQEAIDTFKAAAALARDAGAAHELAQAAMGFSEAEIVMDPPERQSAVLLEEALSALHGEEDAVRCGLLSRLGQVLFTRGDSDRATALMREATDLARRLGDPHALFDARISAWTGTAGQPVAARDFPLVRRDCEEIVAAAEAIGDPHRVGRALSFCLPSMLEIVDIAGFEACFTRISEIGGRDQGFVAQAYAALSAAAMRAILRGEFAEAARLAGHALDAAAIDAEVATGVYGVQMFTIRREQGRLAEVAPVLKRFMEDNPRDNAWRPGLALIASELGFVEPARRAFEEIAAAGLTPQIDAKWNLTLSYLAEVCVRLGDADRAERLYELLLPYRDTPLVVPIATVCCGANARFLGMLAACLGDWPAATEHFEAALDIDERLQAWPWLAHSKHEFASALLARGRARDRRRAETMLGEAAASAERLGMPTLQQKIRAIER